MTDWVTISAEDYRKFIAYVNSEERGELVRVVRGRWVRDEYGVIHCSVCNAYLKDEEYENHAFKKCYYCGADMREVDDG